MIVARDYVPTWHWSEGESLRERLNREGELFTPSVVLFDDRDVVERPDARRGVGAGEGDLGVVHLVREDLDRPAENARSPAPVSTSRLSRPMRRSGSEARRMISQGAVKLDDRVVTEQEIPRADLANKVLRVGQRRLFLPAKLNLAQDPDGLAYRIEDGRVPHAPADRSGARDGAGPGACQDTLSG